MSSPEAKEAPAAEASSGDSSGKTFLLLALVNTLAVAGTAGLLAYTKLVFKRPPITEAQERAKLEQLKAKQEKTPLVPGIVTFDRITVNIKPSQPQLQNKAQAEGQMRYAVIEFAMELKDGSKKAEIEDLKPVFMDKLMSLLGRKSLSDLTTVQGRFLVRTEIMDAINDLINKSRNDKAHGKRAAKGAADKAGQGGGHAVARAEHGAQRDSEDSREPAALSEDEEEKEILQPRDVLVTNIYFTHFVVQ